MVNKSRGERRGRKWAALKVKWRVALRGRGNRTKRALETMIAVLEGNRAPEGTRVSCISWINPDAQDEINIRNNPGADFLYDKKDGLPTLNRGEWLVKKLKAKLSELR